MSLTLFGQDENRNTEHKTVTLRRGQVLELSLVTPLDSGQARVGDEITFKLERALQADHATILPKDWPVHARITKVSRAGKNCKSATMRWQFDPVTTPQGLIVKMQAIPWYTVRPTGGSVEDRVQLESTGRKIGQVADYALAVPISIVTLPYLVLLYIGMRGEGDCSGNAGLEQQVPAGTHFYAAVSRDVRSVRPLITPSL
jgi:hypothetical protein